MIYNNPTDTYRTTLGGYPASTSVNYYVFCNDGQNDVRSPESAYSQLIWDFPAGTGGAGGGGSFFYFGEGIGAEQIIILFMILTLSLFLLIYGKKKIEDMKKS